MDLRNRQDESVALQFQIGKTAAKPANLPIQKHSLIKLVSMMYLRINTRYHGDLGIHYRHTVTYR